MKSVLCMLIFGLLFNACGESLCTESCTCESDKEEIFLIIDNQQDTRHSITDSKCQIINEWLNQKSIGHFLSNHISLESGISSFDKKTHFNHTFIP